jgi:hypothetical protein
VNSFVHQLETAGSLALNSFAAVTTHRSRPLALISAAAASFVDSSPTKAPIHCKNRFPALLFAYTES